MLPNISSSINVYTLPITGKVLKLSPMKVGDVKAIASSSLTTDEDDIESKLETVISILDRLNSGEKIDFKTLPIADFEMAFLKLKMISSGSRDVYNIPCEHCELSNEVEIDLDTDVNIQNEKNDKRITDVTLKDDIGIKVRLLTYNDIIFVYKNYDNEVDRQFQLMKLSVEKIYTKDSVTPASDISEDEFEEWFNSFNMTQMTELEKAISSMPLVEIKTKFNCIGCSKDNEISVKGFDDFLS